MRIDRLKEYFEKCKSMEGNLEGCNCTVKYEDDLGCEEKHIVAGMGLFIDGAGQIKDFKLSMNRGSVYICAFLVFLGETLVGLKAARVKSDKVMGRLKRFFGVEKDDAIEVKATEYMLSKLISAP